MKYFFALTSVLFVQYVSSQTLEEIELCTALQSNQFYSEVEANSALDRILDTSGLAKNFILTQCDNIDNAAAISYKGVRYILYDKEFLQTITDSTNDWANLFILAHEVGHHLNGHSVDVSMIDIVEKKTLEAKRKQELEADEFAAFVLAQLGAPLKAITAPIDLVVSNADDTYSTHPNKTKRLMAIRKGYEKYEYKAASKKVDTDIALKEEKLLKNESKSVKANVTKIESKFGSSDDIWNLTDFSENPFSEIVHVASVKGKVLNSDIDNVLFEIHHYKEKNPVFKLINLNELLWVYTNKAKSLKKITSSQYVSEFVDYKMNFDVSIAVDKELICSGTISFEESLSSSRLFNFKINRESIIDYIGRWNINDLMKSIQKGSQLFIKIDKYDVTAKGKGYSTNSSFSIYDDTHLDEELILSFSLKGSSDALKWYSD